MRLLTDRSIGLIVSVLAPGAWLTAAACGDSGSGAGSAGAMSQGTAGATGAVNVAGASAEGGSLTAGNSGDGTVSVGNGAGGVAGGIGSGGTGEGGAADAAGAGGTSSASGAGGAGGDAGGAAGTSSGGAEVAGTGAGGAGTAGAAGTSSGAGGVAGAPNCTCKNGAAVCNVGQATTGFCKEYPELTNCADCRWIAALNKSGPGNPPLQECDPNSPQFLQANSGPTPTPPTANVIDTPTACASGLTLTELASLADNKGVTWVYATGCRLLSGDASSVFDFGATQWFFYGLNQNVFPYQCVNPKGGTY